MNLKECRAEREFNLTQKDRGKAEGDIVKRYNFERLFDVSASFSHFKPIVESRVSLFLYYYNLSNMICIFRAK